MNLNDTAMLGKRVFYIRPTGWTGIIALSVFFLLFMALIMHTILVRVQQVKQIVALCDKLLTAYRWDHEWKRLVDLTIATLFASLLCNHAFSFTIPFCFFKRVFFSGLFRSLYYRPWIPSLLQYRGKIQIRLSIRIIWKDRNYVWLKNIIWITLKRN